MNQMFGMKMLRTSTTPMPQVISSFWESISSIPLERTRTLCAISVSRRVLVRKWLWSVAAAVVSCLVRLCWNSARCRSWLGKSTSISLLLRLYEPSSGVITIGGRSISNYSLTHLRRSVGVVSQEPVCIIFRS